MYETEKYDAVLKQETLTSGVESSCAKKAEALDEAIRNINSVVCHARDILKAISEPVPEPEPSAIKDERGDIYLESVLNYGPKRIHESCDKAHSLLDGIANIII